MVQSQSGTFGSSNNHFTFNWNTTPFNAGCYFFTLNLDSGQSETTTSPLTLLIFESDTTPHILSTTLPTATAAIPYTNTIQESGGTGALTWSITAGALPSGMSLGPNSGTVAGTPTTAGNYNFTVKVTDSLGNFGTQAFTLKVLIFLSDSAPPTINTTLPPATAGIAYSNTIQTTGGTGMLTWSITAGALPPGLSLSQLGVVSGTPTTADNYSFTVQVTDSASPANVASQAFTLKVLIFESDSNAPAVTTNLPAGTVGSPYSNTIDEDGGTGTLTWSITAGALPPGLSLSQLGVVSGTPTAPGNYNFTVQVTDSASPPNVATLAFMLSVADAQYGDLIVVDGSPLASPLAGTLFRITPTGTSGTIAAISNGSPTGVAVDPASGNIYVAADSVGGNGTSRIVKVGPTGTLTDPFVPGLPAEGAVLQNPVAVAVDASGNVYVGDNSTNVIYEFSSSGTPVGTFASLPSSHSVPNHIRMTFDSLGNLDVASDNIGGVSGQVEVDQVPSGGGTLTVLYNTTTNSTAATYTLTAASAAVSGNTTYTGTFSTTLCVGSSVAITGFAITANNGTFIVQSCTSTMLVVNNPNGMMDTSGGTATLQPTAIGTVGGIAVFSDGSIDVADYVAQTIYKITNPGMTNMAITADISATSALCCNMSGMANPPGVPTTLFVTLTGAKSTTPQLQQAVPATSTVTTVNSTYALTAASAASGGNTTYTGTFSPTIPVGSLVTITGFTNATNNGTFTVVSCSSTQLVVNNGSGIAETNPGIAVTAPLTFPNDVAWYDYPPPG
ncbi:MAG: putative Ig domain-containing protein [Terracidiphilus sp.]